MSYFSNVNSIQSGKKDVLSWVVSNNSNDSAAHIVIMCLYHLVKKHQQRKDSVQIFAIETKEN